ncbi:MAG TPA: DUF5667 domain-containing protein [Candidatus Paceibacterota bacterium]|nr:DUF5667 domain-containing protein [Candidatus Paceibacterota bacterium]
MTKIFLSLIAIGALGGIFTLASGSAVPGSVLYPFKIGVCESIGRIVAVDETSKASFSLEIIRQRLLELQILEQNGTATPDRQEYLLSAFDTEVKRVQDEITVLQVEEKFDEAKALAVSYQNILSKQIAVFNALGSPAVPHLQAALNDAQALTLSSKK